MHSSGSIIKTYCEKVRHYLDDPDIDAKYDDNYLVRFFLSSAMSDVIGRVSMMADNQIICMLTISVVNGTTYYKLPPSVKQVLRIGVQDPNTGWFTEDFRPRNEFHLAGPGWALEGNLLAFRPTPSESKNYLVMYVPSGDIAAHHGTTGTLNANGTFTLGTPNIGSLDKRDNAYAGSYIRILGANITDELIITSHDPVTGIMTLRNPPANAAGTYTYEVIPFLMEPMTDAISISAAMRAGVGRKINQVTMQNLALAYKQAIKTSHDTIGNMNSRVGKRFTGTIDPVGGYTIGTSGSAATTGTCAPCGAAGGDLGGTYPNPTVDGLQGRSVASTAPTNGQALVWNSSTSSWGPATVSGGGGSGTVTSITPAADSGTGTAITTSGTITVAGTANEVETSVSGTTVTVGLPSAITVTEVNVDLVDFNTGVVSPTDAVGRQYWDATWETVSLGLDANVSLKHGQQIYLRGHNSTGSQINRGSVVYVAGGHATTEALIALSDADSEPASSKTVGVAAEDIAHGSTGFVQVFGYMSALTTNGYSGSEGSALYLSDTAGAMTSTLPTQPKHGLRVGFLVKKAGAGAGSIFINIQNYQELDELSDVLIGTLAEQDLLSWDNTAGVWKNRTFSAAGVASATRTITAGTGLTGGGDLTADRTISASFGTSAGTIAEGNHTHSLSGLTQSSATSGQVPTWNGTAWAASTPKTVATDTIWDAAGDLAVGSGADTAARLAIGTAGQVLKVNSGATGLEWGIAGGTDTYSVWTPLDNQPTATNFATLDTRNSIVVLDFDDGATNEQAVFVGIIPQGFVNPASGTSLQVFVHWVPTTTPGSTTYVRWGAAFQKIIATTIASDSFDSIGSQETRTAASTSAGIASVTQIDIPYNKIDSLVAGDAFRLLVYRDSSDTDVNTGDNLTGDAELIAVELRKAPVTGGA